MLLTNTGWIICSIISIGVAILYPLIMVLIARRRLKVGWRYIGFGALIFFLFQLITRIPIVTWLQSLLGPQLQASPTLNLLWMIALALTAGLTEELGRYVGYRWLMKREEKTWAKAVMFGLGHGGFESVVFVGGMLSITLINVLVLAGMEPSILPAGVEAQLAAINASPAWVQLLPAWERIWTVVFHIAASVMVFHALSSKRISWLWIAVIWHAIVDFFAVELAASFTGLTGVLLAEGWMTLMGLISIWIIWRWHPRVSQATHPLITNEVALGE